MSAVEKLLEDRELPDLLAGSTTPEAFEKRKDEIRELLANSQYGVIPPKPDHMDVEVTLTLENFACGLAVLRRLKFTLEIGEERLSFPVVAAIPKNKTKIPAFVNVAFERGDAGKYTPTEEIVERGFAVFTFCYLDVTSDNNDFKNGIAKHLVKSRRNGNASSKISLWAWAAMRVMDYVQTLGDVIDLDNVAIIGHSRLGKTALVTGGYDTRFKYVISNDSGCAGAAIERGKVGETYKKISEVFPFWFSPAFNRKAAKEEQFPFDQHFLMSLTVPRELIIGSAIDDVWADPTSEFLGAASLSEAYALYGKKGLVHNDEVPGARTVLDEGCVSYYVRHGTHFLSRHDWNTYMDIIEKKLEK